MKQSLLRESNKQAKVTHRVGKAGIDLGIELRANNIVVIQLLCVEERKRKVIWDLESQKQVC